MSSSSAVKSLFKSVAKALRPPRDMSYSEWAIANFRLSAVASADTGRFRPWKFQRGILDAIGDMSLERVSVIKSTRTGYTKSLIAAIGAIVENDPSPIILLMPTDDDARGVMVDEVDPAFKESPSLRGLMRSGRFEGRNTLTHRSFSGGGSLKAIAAAAPRNLRRHTAKYLFCDEVDGMKITAEGDPIKIAEQRTVSFPDRKIVMGSTPVDDVTSIIITRYNESDQRVFEIPCVHCDKPFELMWEHIHWIPGQPGTAVANCPSCGTDIEERYKPQMVEAGEWRITRPEVKGHAGFRLNALISMFSTVSWSKLVTEYENAVKAGPSQLQVFTNTVLGQVWSASIEYVTDVMLMARVEKFGIRQETPSSPWEADIPIEVAYITAGVDVQVNRVEITFLGHSPENRFILGHHVIWGGTNLQSTWDEVEFVLMTKWQHPLGGMIGIEAAGVDSGDGNRTQYVYDFCEGLQSQKIVAIKGKEGSRKVIEASKTKRRNRTATLYIVGVDQVKTDILVTLPKEKTEHQAFRFSSTLTEDYFLQLNSERRVLTYKQGRPVEEFERVGGRKAEALDTVVYAIAVKWLCRFDYAKRYVELKGGEQRPKKSLKDIVSNIHRKR